MTDKNTNADSFANNVANSVENHLEQLAKNKTDKTAKIENDEFSDSELANLVNPARLKALLDESDAFLNGMQDLIDDE